MIDIAVIKEAYDQQEIPQDRHMFSDQNPADDLPNVKKCQALNAILYRWKLELDVNQLVLRKKKDSIKRVGKVQLSIS